MATTQENAAEEAQRIIAELRRERDAALAREAALAQVLNVINRSPGDPGPVFDAILEKAHTLCGAAIGSLQLYDGTQVRAVASHGFSEGFAGFLRQPYPPSPRQQMVIRGERLVHVADVNSLQVAQGSETMRRTIEDANVRTGLMVPMRKDGVCLGFISAYRTEARLFSEPEIALLESFAAQAVIAMGTARLLGELRERTADLQQSLEYQAATRDVLKVISQSTFDLRPALDTLLETAARLCEADFAIISNREDNGYRVAATFATSEEFSAFYQGLLIPADRGSITGRTAVEGRVVHFNDVTVDPEFTLTETITLGGVRTGLGVPLLRDGVVSGVIGLARRRVEPFTGQQIELVRTFADQAVIAIENTRLIAETREALEQQTATAEMLQVINASPGNLKPVFDAILEKAIRVCESDLGTMHVFKDGVFHTLATRNVPPRWEEFLRTPMRPTPRIALERLVQGEDVVHVADVLADPLYEASPLRRAFADLSGARTAIWVALRKDGQLLGTFIVYRKEVRAFREKQIALLQNFAAQAVIAMENARLLGELRERTEELAERNKAFSERIDHQAATIEVLKQMSASPGDAQPVLDLICRQARALLGITGSVGLFEYDGRLVHHRANPGVEQVVDHAMYAAYLSSFPMVPDRGSLTCRAILDATILHIRDLDSEPGLFQAVRDLGHKSQVSVPLMRDGHGVGAITAASMQVDGISDTQIELLKTFAEQAVIAIGSAETYRALQERTAALAQRNSEFGQQVEYQSATIDVLKVMSSSTSDTQPVFDIILRRAMNLCDCLFGGLYEFDGELVHSRASLGWGPEVVEAFLSQYPKPPSRSVVTDRAILDKQTVYVRDNDAEPGRPQAARDLGHKSTLAVPLLRDGAVIGVIGLGHQRVDGFTDAQIDLLKTFAEQAVIAIGSTATFRELQDRTEALTRSVAELQALEEVMRAVNSSLDLDTVLETIISRAVTLSQADEGTIYEFDDAEEVFVLKATHGMSETRVTRLREARIKLGETYLGRAGLLREPVHVSDLQLDRTLADSTKEALHDIHAVLAVPLLREDKVLGGLVIRRRTTGDFPATIRTLLQTFAAQSVLAIENARLFQDARRARLSAEATLTDLRRTQDRLVQTEKMASLGQLTAGIAHEIKNPLNFVNNFSDLSVDLLNELNDAVAPDKLTVAADLRAEIDDITATLKGNLERIAQHGRRADSIVKSMLLHSRTGPSEHREIDLNATVEEALNLAYHGARAENPGFNITLEKHLDPAGGVIDAFPQEFTRVMLNLMSNGFYAARKRLAAAPPGFEPTLTVSTASHGDFVTIGVRDNGTGMPDSVRDKIFEPFFTTKPAGEGTGLGLSLSFDIVVKQHGGQLTVASEPDKFTEFTVTLPRRVAEGTMP